jgi:Family of unknown function (DUF5684)
MNDTLSLIIPFVLAAFILTSLWRVFEKAGKPGWAAIVPIYNMIVLLEIAQLPGIYVIGFFVPGVNFILGMYVWHEVGKQFGKSDAFNIGLALLSIVFVPILAFTDSEYQHYAA